MSIRPQRFALLLLLPCVGACASVSPFGGAARPGGGISTRNGATILSGVALTNSRGSVLAAMQGNVPNLRVRMRPQGCPEINLRNQAPYGGPVSPIVYVDGARAIDTCILESLRTQDVELVEIYPMGFTSRPGYATHVHGLILVFLLGAT